MPKSPGVSNAELDAALAGGKTNLDGKTDEELAALRGDDGAPAPGSDDDPFAPENQGGTGDPAAAGDGDPAGGGDPDGGDPAAAAGGGKEGDPKGGEPPAKDEPRVPLSRLNAITARNRQRTEALQSRVAELEAQVAAGEEEINFEEVEGELDKLELQHNKLVQEGKTEEAVALRRNIRGIERRVNNVQALHFAEESSNQAVAKMRTDAVVSEFEGKYAFLDPEDEDNYSQEVVDEILAYHKGFLNAGHPSHVAMRMASNYVISQLDLEPEDGGEGAPAAPAKPKGLKEGTLDRKAELAGKLPPNVGGGGKTGVPQSTTAKDIAGMGQQRFNKAKISEDDLAKARGDFL